MGTALKMPELLTEYLMFYKTWKKIERVTQFVRKDVYLFCLW